jgi:hypothetical protein
LEVEKDGATKYGFIKHNKRRILGNSVDFSERGYNNLFQPTDCELMSENVTSMKVKRDYSNNFLKEGAD